MKETSSVKSTSHTLRNPRHNAPSDIPLKRLPQLLRSTVHGKGAQVCTLKLSLEGSLLSNRLFVMGNSSLMLELKEETLQLRMFTAQPTTAAEQLLGKING